jgi:hypothetical protein
MIVGERRDSNWLTGDLPEQELTAVLESDFAGTLQSL